jgi:hypothetical protein
MILLHIVIIKEIIKKVLAGYFEGNLPVQPLNYGKMALNYTLLYSEKIIEKMARP